MESSTSEVGPTVAGFLALCLTVARNWEKPAKISRAGSWSTAGTQLPPGAGGDGREKLTSSRATARRWCSWK